MLAEVYGSPETAYRTFAADLKTALPETSGIAFFAARSPRAEGRAIRSQSAAGATLYIRPRLASYRVSAGAFFQVNRYLTDELVNIVICGGRNAGRTAGVAAATGTALDLYAGVGLFSSVLNREFERVIAVESSPTSHADLLYNSPANVKAVRATTEQYLENAAGKLRPELVVVDPPRSGLGEQSDSGTGEVESPSYHLRFVRSGNTLPRSGSPASIRIPGGGGASRGSISPDLPPGKRLPSRPLAQAKWRLRKPTRIPLPLQRPEDGNPCSGPRWPWPLGLRLACMPGGRRSGGWWHGSCLPCQVRICSGGEAGSAFIVGLGALFFLGALMVQVCSPVDPGHSGWSRFADGSEVMVTAHVTKEGSLQEDGPGSVRERIEVETEQITRDGENFAVTCGLRINVYQQKLKGQPERESSAAPVRLFEYGERLRFPPGFRRPVTTATRARLTTRAISQTTESSLWPRPKLPASRCFPVLPATGLNSGAPESIAASSKRSTPFGRRAKPP